MSINTYLPQHTCIQHLSFNMNSSDVTPMPPICPAPNHKSKLVHKSSPTQTSLVELGFYP